MAAGFIQGQTFTGSAVAGVVTVTAPAANLTVGSTLVMVIRVGANTASPQTVTVLDSSGANPAFTTLININENAGGDGFALAYLPNNQTATKPTYTITLSAGIGQTSSIRANIREYGPCPASSVIDTSNASDQTVGTATPTTSAITTLNASDVLIACWAGNGGTATLSVNGAGTSPAVWGNLTVVDTSKLGVADAVVASTSAGYQQVFGLTGSDTGNLAIVALKLSSSGITLNAASNFAAPSPVLSPQYVGSGFRLFDPVLQNGLNAFALANKIHICSQMPMSYANVATFTIGNSAPGIGSVTTTPIDAGDGHSMQVSTNAVTGGTVTANGNPMAWAIVDDANSRLLSCGPLTGEAAVTAGWSWTLGVLTINMPVQ